MAARNEEAARFSAMLADNKTKTAALQKRTELMSTLRDRKIQGDKYRAEIRAGRQRDRDEQQKTQTGTNKDTRAQQEDFEARAQLAPVQQPGEGAVGANAAVAGGGAGDLLKMLSNVQGGGSPSAGAQIPSVQPGTGGGGGGPGPPSVPGPSPGPGPGPQAGPGAAPPGYRSQTTTSTGTPVRQLINLPTIAGDVISAIDQLVAGARGTQPLLSWEREGRTVTSTTIVPDKESRLVAASDISSLMLERAQGRATDKQVSEKIQQTKEKFGPQLGEQIVANGNVRYRIAQRERGDMEAANAQALFLEFRDDIKGEPGTQSATAMRLAKLNAAARFGGEPEKAAANKANGEVIFKSAERADNDLRISRVGLANAGMTYKINQMALNKAGLERSEYIQELAQRGPLYAATGIGKPRKGDLTLDQSLDSIRSAFTKGKIVEWGKDIPTSFVPELAATVEVAQDNILQGHGKLLLFDERTKVNWNGTDAKVSTRMVDANEIMKKDRIAKGRVSAQTDPQVFNADGSVNPEKLAQYRAIARGWLIDKVGVPIDETGAWDFQTLRQKALGDPTTLDTVTSEINAAALSRFGETLVEVHQIETQYGIFSRGKVGLYEPGPKPIDASIYQPAPPPSPAAAASAAKPVTPAPQPAGSSPRPQDTMNRPIVEHLTDLYRKRVPSPPPGGGSF